jgi:hypothetical protein
MCHSTEKYKIIYFEVLLCVLYCGFKGTVLGDYPASKIFTTIISPQCWCRKLQKITNSLAISYSNLAEEWLPLLCLSLGQISRGEIIKRLETVSLSHSLADPASVAYCRMYVNGIYPLVVTCRGLISRNIFALQHYIKGGGWWGKGGGRVGAGVGEGNWNCKRKIFISGFPLGNSPLPSLC